MSHGATAGSVASANSSSLLLSSTPLHTSVGARNLLMIFQAAVPHRSARTVPTRRPQRRPHTTRMSRIVASATH